ncbi:hydroxyacylglutathione hydrolase [Arenimonas sp.]|jgi:hydroxyacylglutathione hydrolase|uniref:hydroxyacylglutathione hydrolase n=1 Tax=Arenimonas sp. TaxID=1872635 RepID=UPI0037C068AC
MTVLQALPAFEDNYIWCYRGSEGASIVVDPGDAGPVLGAVADGLRIEAVFITHHHNDHICGLSALRGAFTGTVFGPEDERIPGIDCIARNGDVLQIPGFPPFHVLAVPGHTRSHIAYTDTDVLFCGDTLFSLGCGRLFEGSPEQMLASLDRLAELPDETLLCCTHEYTLSNARFAAAAEPNNPDRDRLLEDIQARRLHGRPSLPSRIGIEKACNPFLRTDFPESLSGLKQHLGFMPVTRLARFTALRAWKDQFR